MREITFDQMWACAKREVKYRRRVYRRLVEQGALSEDDAQLEIETMEAIAAHFERMSQPELL